MTYSNFSRFGYHGPLNQLGSPVSLCWLRALPCRRSLDSALDDNVRPQHGMAFAGKCAFYKNYVEFDLHVIGK